MIVIDASLAVKWYATEALSEEAEKVFIASQPDVAVPDIFVTEVIAALVRRANIDKAVRGEADASIANLTDLLATGALKTYRMEPPQLAAAATIAMDLGHPLKDCIYLALAMDLRCALVTADVKFARKARGLWDGVRMLGE